MFGGAAAIGFYALGALVAVAVLGLAHRRDAVAVGA